MTELCDSFYWKYEELSSQSLGIDTTLRKGSRAVTASSIYQLPVKICSYTVVFSITFARQPDVCYEEVHTSIYKIKMQTICAILHKGHPTPQNVFHPFTVFLFTS